MDGATRQIYWNVTHVWLMYLLLVPAVAVGAYGVYRHVSQWRQGLPINRFDRSGQRLRLLLVQVLTQRRTARDAYAGIFHRFIFYGALVLVIATIVVALDADFGMHLMQGWFYLYFQSFAVDVFGGLVLLGILMAAGRRYLTRPPRLIYSGEASCLLATAAAIVVTGFLLQGWRIAATHDPWGAWSPLGKLTASISSQFMSEGAMQRAHAALWWFHLTLSFAFLAWLPYTKMLHAITGPLNIYTANLEPLGACLKPIDFDKAASLGVNSLKAFTWKDLLDLDACTECGRCSDHCPANRVGKELSPRDLILQLRRLMRITPVAHGHPEGDTAPALIGASDALSAERLWQCTTCGACVEACPVLIEQMPKIVDLRRYLVMEQAEFPKALQEVITSLESRGHPFRGTRATRLTWADGLDISQAGEGGDFEVLLWVGCSAALMERNQKIVRATAQLLSTAGVRFAILGREEHCCGDPARRVGNEFLFENVAKGNIETLNGYGIKRVVTPCPHCFNTLKNEYPRLGGKFEVIHHSEYLAQLLDAGRLARPSAASCATIAYHDPCYLGRQNGVYAAPRRVLQAVQNSALIEMERRMEGSFCCGGGGGMSFVEEPANQRVNQERARQVLSTGADTLAVACPFCLLMMEDGINARKGDRQVRVEDISEILWESTHRSILASDPMADANRS